MRSPGKPLRWLIKEKWSNSLYTDCLQFNKSPSISSPRWGRLFVSYPIAVRFNGGRGELHKEFHFSVMNSDTYGLISRRNIAVDKPTALKIIHITIIWYLTAIRGEIPDKICPVIIPGRETNPTAKRELVIGINAALNAMLWTVLQPGLLRSWNWQRSFRQGGSNNEAKTMDPIVTQIELPLSTLSLPQLKLIIELMCRIVFFSAEWSQVRSSLQQKPSLITQQWLWKHHWIKDWKKEWPLWIHSFFNFLQPVPLATLLYKSPYYVHQPKMAWFHNSLLVEYHSAESCSLLSFALGLCTHFLKRPFHLYILHMGNFFAILQAGSLHLYHQTSLPIIGRSQFQYLLFVIRLSCFLKWVLVTGKFAPRSIMIERFFGRLAQLVRALSSHGRSRGFKSLIAH